MGSRRGRLAISQSFGRARATWLRVDGTVRDRIALAGSFYVRKAWLRDRESHPVRVRALLGGTL